MLTRRHLVQGAAATLACFAPGVAVRAEDHAFGVLPSHLAEIEAESGGRLGVAVLDRESGVRAAYRAGERFPLCSTFKMLAVGAVLASVDAGHEQLSSRIRFGAAEVLAYEPVTKDHVGGDGMSLVELCEAAITLSDNTAANLLLGRIGGPAGLTAYLRRLGDVITRLDRIEPDLNEALPDDPRDTTTPAAMLDDLDALTLGNALAPSSRDRLVAWLKACQTGEKQLRAGLPREWTVGDKTGSGERGTTNDVGVIWRPNQTPVLLTCYLTGTTAPVEKRHAILAKVGRAVASTLGG